MYAICFVHNFSKNYLNQNMPLFLPMDQSFPCQNCSSPMNIHDTDRTLDVQLEKDTASTEKKLFLIKISALFGSMCSQ